MRRQLLALTAAGLVATALPIQSASAEDQFGGFSATSTATPVRIEIYEPTIPIPAEPQLELNLAYTSTESASGPTSKARASWLWPGGAVGEGFKTIVENLGFPDEVADELGKNGYPVQVNSQSPGGAESEKDEPFPFAVMRAESSSEGSSAKVGFSPDGNVDDSEEGTDSPLPDSPLPDLPGLDGLGELGELGDLGAAITGKNAAAPDDPGTPGLPPELTALVDMSGTTSVSTNTFTTESVTTKATSGVTGLRLIGGLITGESIKVVSTSTTNGSTSSTDVNAKVVGLAVAGNAFIIDQNGISAVGQQSPIPGLPDEPKAALKALGVSFELPQGERTLTKTDGADAASWVRGLQIEIDTAQLRSQLDSIPFDDIVSQIPDDAGQLKSLLQAAVHATPRIVIVTGNAASSTASVPEVTFPTGEIDPPALPGDTGGDAAGGAGGAAGGAGGDAGVPSSTEPADSGAGTGDTDAVATENVAAGLPPLASLPGMLLVGGLLLASAVGFWLQKIGAFVIGGAGSCAHGLDTGVPDLRKA